MQKASKRFGLILSAFLFGAVVFHLGQRTSVATRGVTVSIIDGGPYTTYQVIDEENGVVCYTLNSSTPLSCVKK